jgi:hypothetical protein
MVAVATEQTGHKQTHADPWACKHVAYSANCGPCNRVGSSCRTLLTCSTRWLLVKAIVAPHWRPATSVVLCSISHCLPLCALPLPICVCLPKGLVLPPPLRLYSYFGYAKTGTGPRPLSQAGSGRFPSSLPPPIPAVPRSSELWIEFDVGSDDPPSPSPSPSLCSLWRPHVCVRGMMRPVKVRASFHCHCPSVGSGYGVPLGVSGMWTLMETCGM